MHERRQVRTDPNCDDCSSRPSSVFSDLDASELRVLSSTKSCRSYSRGDYSFYSRDQPAGLHCVHGGKIKICKNGPDTREHIVRLVGAGDVMGYRSLLGGSPYSCSAVALEESRICLIPRAEFRSMIATQAGLGIRLMELLSRELRSAEEKLVELAQKSARERLAETLLLLKAKYGVEENGETLAVKLTREEIAGLVGAATENVIRLLSDFRREGLIELDRKNIRLLDEARLADTANVRD